MATKLYGLNDTEICVIYYRFKAFQVKIDKIIETTKRIDDLNQLLEKPVYNSDEDNKITSQVLNSELYNICIDIVNKLGPIVELIEENDPSITRLK